MSNENNQNTTENTEAGTPCVSSRMPTLKSFKGFLFMGWILLGIAVVLHNLIG